MNIPQGPILVVEDIQHIRQLLEVTLKFEGYPVVTASNGAEALEKVIEQRPALIITDLLMPKMDGYSLIFHLRSKAETRDIPIVVLSATYVDREDKEFALSLGAVKFMEKPVDTPELLLSIGEILAEGVAAPASSLDDLTFYSGYQGRLEVKLRQKNQQIARTERLLQTLPDEQQEAFQTLLNDAREHREAIKAELDQTLRKISELTRGKDE
ncbi:MAG: response regulator [Chloroflexi bacterium]|nr:response regulator [Chloroflexota bacterium]